MTPSALLWRQTRCDGQAQYGPKVCAHIGQSRSPILGWRCLRFRKLLTSTLDELPHTVAKPISNSTTLQQVVCTATNLRKRSCDDRSSYTALVHADRSLRLLYVKISTTATTDVVLVTFIILPSQAHALQVRSLYKPVIFVGRTPEARSASACCNFASSSITFRCNRTTEVHFFSSKPAMPAHKHKHNTSTTFTRLRLRLRRFSHAGEKGN